MDIEKDYDEELEEIDQDIVKKHATQSLDNDLKKYFEEDGLEDFNNISNNSYRNKRGNKALKNVYELGDKIICNNKNGKIIFGPYEISKVNWYEIENELGEVFSLSEKNIKKA